MLKFVSAAHLTLEVKKMSSRRLNSHVSYVTSSAFELNKLNISNYRTLPVFDRTEGSFPTISLCLEFANNVIDKLIRYKTNE